MELLILLGAVLLVMGAVVTLVVTRRRGEAPELEPPPAPPASPVEPPPQAQAPAERATAERIEPPTTAPPVDEEFVAEIEEALAPALEPEVLEPEVTAPEVAVPPVRPSFRDRLGKARSLLSGYVGSMRSRSKIDEETWEELEEALIRADVGVSTTIALLEALRLRVESEGVTEPDALLALLKEELKGQLAGDRTLRFEPGSPNVWLFVGVNGVGKTTTIGKVGRREATEGRTVIMAAGDTFRAAAAEQLGQWAERVGADLVRGSEGGDPSSVIYDAVQRAASRGIDLVLADTAGRLHTKVNLMEELRKVRRVAAKPPGNVTEVFLVLDATTGQNGLNQATQFAEAAEITGVVLTKLDGSAKGGIVLAVQSALGIPVKLVGLGESADDLVDFDPEEFIEALFA